MHFLILIVFYHPSLITKQSVIMRLNRFYSLKDMRSIHGMSAWN